jgi:hypothetical protein
MDAFYSQYDWSKPKYASSRHFRNRRTQTPGLDYCESAVNLVNANRKGNDMQTKTPNLISLPEDIEFCTQEISQTLADLPPSNRVA